MNKVILLGRLVKDPEIRYANNAEHTAVARYHLAVNRRSASEGAQKADFIPCVAFGKSAEFAEKYLKKGQMVSIVGRLQVRGWNDNDGSKRWSTDVIVEEVYFTAKAISKDSEGFREIDEETEDDLPF